MNDYPLADALAEVLRPLVDELVVEALDRRLGTQHAASEWLTVEEYAETMRTTPAAVHKRLERGRIAGALREGRRWLIPAAATLSPIPRTEGRAPR